MPLRLLRRLHHVLLQLLLGLVATSSAQATQIFVEPATGSGVKPAELTSVTELVKVSVSEVSGSNQLTEKRQEADEILQPRILRLGEAYVLTLAKYREGKPVFSSQLKAAHLSELDKVALRLTRSVLLEEKASSNPRTGEITDQEEKDGTQRRPARKMTYLGFGAASLAGHNTTAIGYSIAGAYSWDVNFARLKILLEGDFSGAALFASASLGGNYYLSHTDSAPYVSADFGFGVAKPDGGAIYPSDTLAGFVFGAGGGLELLRAHAVNLDIGFRAAFLLRNGDFGMPVAGSLRLGLHF